MSAVLKLPTCSVEQGGLPDIKKFLFHFSGSSFTSRTTGRTFRSRFLRSHLRDPSTDDEKANTATNATANNNNDTSNISDEAQATANKQLKYNS